jgi:hypothetical protein
MEIFYAPRLRPDDGLLGTYPRIGNDQTRFSSTVVLANLVANEKPISGLMCQQCLELSIERAFKVIRLDCTIAEATL